MKLDTNDPSFDYVDVMCSASRELEAARQAFQARAEEIAMDALNKVIVPFCKKHGYTFCVGNGTYAFFKGKKLIDPLVEEQHDIRVQGMIAILDTEIPGTRGFETLSDWMQNWG